MIGRVQFPVDDLDQMARRFDDLSERLEQSSRWITEAANGIFIHPASPALTGRLFAGRTAQFSNRMRIAVNGAAADSAVIRNTASAARAADSPGDTVFDTMTVDWLPKPLPDQWAGDETFDWIVDNYSEGRQRLRRAAGFVWDFSGQVYDEVYQGAIEGLGRVGNAADDLAIGLIMARIRSFRLTVGFMTEFSAVAPAAPHARALWNRHINPYLVGELMGVLEGPLGGKPSEGDLGGQFTTRSGKDFAVDGSTDVARGRNAVIKGLDDTGNSAQIKPDEFEIIDHGDNRYTLVLPGVTDLSSPNQGLNPQHRSVRDTDFSAARSTASATVDDNVYAQYVMEYASNNLPHGSSIAIVGHSFGADTAVDLAADPTFNGEYFTVTHVTAAAYHSEPQLASVPQDTQVLVLQNNKDVPVMVEEVGHASSLWEMLAPRREGIVLKEFSGGWQGAGHHQDNYTDYLAGTDDAEVESFLMSLHQGGYSTDGTSTSIDVSVPESDDGP